VSFMRGEPYANLRSLAERAVRLSDSLPDRQRSRARAMLAAIDTRGRDAADALDRILTLDSLDHQAWTLLAYVRSVYGWQYGATERDAVDAVEHALRLDSTNVPNLANRVHLAVATNDVAEVERQVARVRAVDSSSAIARGTLHGIEAILATDAEFPAIVDRLASASTPDWIGVFRVLREYRMDRAELLAARAMRETGAPLARVAMGGLVQLYAAEGRWRLIDSLQRAHVFDQVTNFDRLLLRETVGAAISGTADEDRGRAAAAALAVGRSPDSARAQFERQPVWLEGWLIGAYHAMYGDTTLARRWQVALRALPRGGSPPEYNAALDADIEARLAGRRGDRALALEQARRAYGLWTVHTENQYEFLPEPAIRFNLALLLRAARESHDAGELFRSLVPPTTWMGFYTPRAALELAELEEASGNRANARRYYLTALRSWEQGDSTIAPFRDRARRGLTRVGN